MAHFARLVIAGSVFLAAASQQSVTSAGDRLNVLYNAGFEQDVKEFSGWYAVGVVPKGGLHGITITDGNARAGKRFLRITPGPKGRVKGLRFFPSYNADESSQNATGDDGVKGARSFAMRVEPSIFSASLSAWIRRSKDSPVKLSAVWTGRRSRTPVVEVARDVSTEPVRVDGEWELWELSSRQPREAHQVQLVVETNGTDAVDVDEARLILHRKSEVTILIDQLGWESRSKAKGIVLQSSMPLRTLGSARLIDSTTETAVATSPWTAHGHLPSWDYYHWSADFSDYDRPGRYRVSVQTGEQTVVSPEFEIADDLIARRTSELAYRFYYYQRCGVEIPGFHEACHLDDALLADGQHRDLTGGWHDAGDYNKYNGLTPEAAHFLALAWHRKPKLFADRDADANGLPDILDEARWGVHFLRKMLDDDSLELLNAVSSGYRYWGPPEKETDNRPNSGDERPVTPGAGDLSHLSAAFAWLGRALIGQSEREYQNEGKQLIDLAERLFKKTGGGVDRLVPLYRATGKVEYRQNAKARVVALLESQPSSGVQGFRELAQYVIAFPDDPIMESIKPLATRRVDELLKQCDARFGVACGRDADGQPVYTRDYKHPNDWYVGDTSVRLDAAIDALYAARLGDNRGQQIAENQVHWLLGRNPFGASFMEGVGSRFVPLYHHRYNAIPGNPRGAVPGALINGIIRAWPHVDRPWLDLHREPNPDYHSNEPWLLHNNRWLMLLTLW